MATLTDDGIRIIDADTHFTEPHDLWTRRAPAAYKDRVPHVEEIDGEPTWVVDGDVARLRPRRRRRRPATARRSRSSSRWTNGPGLGPPRRLGPQGAARR